MEISWYGQSCFKIKGKTATVIIDPYDSSVLGLKLPKDFSAPLVLATHSHADHHHLQAVADTKLVIEGPGDYEFMGVSVSGTRTFHDAVEGAERGRNTSYNILIDGVKIVHLGDLGHLLSEDQVNEIGSADILMIPVGGVYTIDGKVASAVVAQLEPRIIIPMHFKIDDLKADLETNESFLKEMGIDHLEAIPKLVITREKLPEETSVVVLSKS